MIKDEKAMTQDEQKQFILNFILDWTGSKERALEWYETTVIPALNKTAQKAVIDGDFEAMKKYLEHIEQGGFA